MINFVKTQPAPACLASEKSKSSGTYRCGDVAERCNTDFYGKCYICEDKDISSINIEHFIAHQGDIDLKFDWNNLFLACAYCNNIKLANTNFNNILNCIENTPKITDCVLLSMNPYPFEQVMVKALDRTIKTKNTADLLEKVYNAEHTGIKTAGSLNLRKRVFNELLAFQRLLNEYYDEATEDSERDDISKKIRRKLHKSTAFTAFKIGIIEQNKQFKTDFAEFLM
jgi:LEA14-like dessication related protein